LLQKQTVAQEPDAQTVREELEKILASPAFVRNERLGRFLRFIVEHSLQGGPQIKESTVGVEVFGRKADYDPKIDSVVRTEAARLRNRLADYYRAHEGFDTLVIEVPKGGYTPVFRLRTAPPVRKATPSKRFAIAVAVAVLLPVFWLLFTRENSAPSIAVIPIQNLSAEPENEFFADGLTDEIIRNLAIIEGLDVRSRTSSFALRISPGVCGKSESNLAQITSSRARC
jgi:hypothetical protein